MHSILKKIPLLLLLLTGCAGPLMVNYTPSPPAEAVKLKGAGSILVKPFVDAREPTSYPLVIGSISTTVSDLIGNKLELDRDPTTIVTEAFAKELSSAGFAVVASGNSDYILSGKLKEFRLDLGTRDKIAIEVYSKLTGPDGTVLWEGVKRESTERFAGVMGNSRRKISDYISETLAKVIRGSIAEATVTNGPAAAKKISEKGIAKGKGRLSITTEPERAKIYLNDVYYGLTPNSIDIAPGIYDLKLKKTGYTDRLERLAVRDGKVTVLEAGLSVIAPPSK